MTPEQYVKIKALSRCVFQPASYTKRFVRDIETKSFDDTLTDKQAAYLDKLYYMYRGQIRLQVQSHNTILCAALNAVGMNELPEFVKPEEA